MDFDDNLFPKNIWQDRKVSVADFHNETKEEFFKQFSNGEIAADAMFKIAVVGLNDYFDLCKKYKDVSLPMPSEVIDFLWHKMILNTRKYKAFCEEKFGYLLHHDPFDKVVKKIAIQDDKIMMNLWVAACEMDGMDPLKSKPLLFYVDVLAGVKCENYIDNIINNLHNRSQKEDLNIIRQNRNSDFFSLSLTAKYSIIDE